MRGRILRNLAKSTLFFDRNGCFSKKGTILSLEVIQRSNSVGHAVTVISSHHPATEKLLQCVEELNITLMLHDREFGEHLKLAGHFRMGIDADVETTFSVNKTHHPLGL